jgi:hypothetical protein
MVDSATAAARLMEREISGIEINEAEDTIEVH